MLLPEDTTQLEPKTHRVVQNRTHILNLFQTQPARIASDLTLIFQGEDFPALHTSQHTDPNTQTRTCLNPAVTPSYPRHPCRIFTTPISVTSTNRSAPCSMSGSHTSTRTHSEDRMTVETSQLTEKPPQGKSLGPLYSQWQLWDINRLRRIGLKLCAVRCNGYSIV